MVGAGTPVPGAITEHHVDLIWSSNRIATAAIPGVLRA